MKLIIGAGGTEQPGWVSLRESELDITNAEAWARLFKPDSLEAIVAEHVWEHLTLEEGLAATANCFKYLKPGGRLRIAVPDGFHPDQKYIAWVRPGTGFNGDDHKVLFTYHMLARMLMLAGFAVVLREWFDEAGDLHLTRLNDDFGYIRRSIRSFWAWVLSVWLRMRYTSLIVDGVKPLTSNTDTPSHTRLAASHGFRLKAA